MGFDLFIRVEYHLSPKTGKPFYYNKNFEKVYDPPELKIPQHLCKYLRARGGIFHAYVEEFDSMNQTSTDAFTFLNEYPLWEKVKNSEWYDESYEDSWTEKEHNEFRELLVYLTESYDCTFTVCWSY